MIADSAQPISLRVSVTDRCPSRCLYCLPPEGAQIKDGDTILSYEQIVGFVSLVKSRFGLSKVHLTGGEPLIRPGIVDLVAMLASQGIEDLAMTTNAQGLASMAGDLKQAGLKRINVSLDSLDERTFESLTRGRPLRQTLEGLRAAEEAGFSPIKLNTVVLKGHNDTEVTSIAKWAIGHGYEIRFLELMPIGPAVQNFQQWFVSSAQVRCTLSKTFDLSPEPATPGSSSRRFKAAGDGPGGFISFISSHSRPFCAGCRRLRLTACGKLVGCLAMGKALDIRPLLGDRTPGTADRINEVVNDAIGLKRDGKAFVTRNLMTLTGG